jgi:hypothetical protein
MEEEHSLQEVTSLQIEEVTQEDVADQSRVPCSPGDGSHASAMAQVVFSSLQNEEVGQEGVTDHSRTTFSRGGDPHSLTKAQVDAISSKRALHGSQRGSSHRRIKSSGSNRGLAGRTRSRSRIGNVFRKTGNAIHTVESAHPPRLVGELGNEEEATWVDVYHACCCHTAKEWIGISSFLAALLLLLYFFLVGLDLLGTSFAIVGGCTAGSLLGSDTSPLASVMIGIIATAILQSSSTTTAIVVSLVSGGLDVKQGIYMVMGANLGTTITAMLVSLAHISDSAELQRAFAGSSMYFIFNFLTLFILFPLEVTTGYLYKLTKAMLPSTVSEGDSWEGECIIVEYDFPLSAGIC